MAHKADYELLLEVENNELVLTQFASWRSKKLDILKYNFTKDKTYMRWGNIDFHRLGGWLVSYPGENSSSYWYYGSETILNPYNEAEKYADGLKYGRLLAQDSVKETILKVHPEFKYLLNKINFNSPTFTIFKLLDAMRMWYSHPSEVETLASKGFYKILLNKNLYKLSNQKKKQVVNALKNFNGEIQYDLKLKDIQEFINSKLTFKEWYDYRIFNGWYNDKGRDSLEIFRYCVRKNINRTRYHDMISMAIAQGHDIEDEYWKFPNDPEAMHERLLQVKMELDRLREEEQRQKEIVFWDALETVKNKNLKKPVDLGEGYILFMPTTYDEYNAAATVLHQCILAGGYYKKVATGQSLLFMIWKDGKPSSTLELDYNNRKLQFYGNEINRFNCKPSEYEQEAINKWLLTFKAKKIKEFVRE